VSSLLEILKKIKLYIFFGKNLFRSSTIKIKIETQYKLLGKHILDTYKNTSIDSEVIEDFYKEVQILQDELNLLEQERNIHQ